MSTTVTFAGNLAEAPELHHTGENNPFVTCHVLVNRRIQKDHGEWGNDEPPHTTSRPSARPLLTYTTAPDPVPRSSFTASSAPRAGRTRGGREAHVGRWWLSTNRFGEVDQPWHRTVRICDSAR